jgi:Family of unknown function (DUF5681)
LIKPIEKIQLKINHMPFIKGQSGNPKGKPPGTKNKVINPLRQIISDFLEQNFETIQADFKKLPPKDRAKVYSDLLQYGLPKLQTTSLDIDFNNCTDEQLDYLLDQLRGSIKE